jgi:hypothetical protein
MLVDRNAQHPNRPIELQPKVFFGCLKHIFVVHLNASCQLNLDQPTTLILASIHQCSDMKTYNHSDRIYYYSQLGNFGVVDIACVQCVVGRVKDGNQWAILDRSNDQVRPTFHVGDQ